MTTASAARDLLVASARRRCARGRLRGTSGCTDRGRPPRRPGSSSSRITSSAGLSRMSSMSFLYATPSTRMRLPFTALRSSFSACATFLDDERRHLAVDLAGEVDEARLVVQRAHLPREVVRIERDAVSADARARRELHEAERLRRRRVDDFPHVHAELVADDRHLVHEPDVHRPERVLEQLHQLGRFRASTPERPCRCTTRRARPRLRCTRP